MRLPLHSQYNYVIYGTRHPACVFVWVHVTSYLALFAFVLCKLVSLSSIRVAPGSLHHKPRAARALACVGFRRPPRQVSAPEAVELAYAGRRAAHAASPSTVLRRRRRCTWMCSATMSPHAGRVRAFGTSRALTATGRSERLLARLGREQCRVVNSVRDKERTHGFISLGGPVGRAALLF